MPKQSHYTPTYRRLTAAFLRRAAFAALTAASLILPPVSGNAASRIKDIVSIEGVRDNVLVGYGLVVGLDGTGDKIRNSPFTKQSLESMLERLGINTRGSDMKTENVAAVMVTANLGSFTRNGSRIDVTVSSMGDAKNLKGGTLLATPLMGADGEVYAVAQGPVQIAGFAARGEAAQITQGVPTSGRIPNGGIIEREINFAMNGISTVNLQLKSPDFTTASRIATVINRHLGSDSAQALDPATVQLRRPEGYRYDTVSLITSIEQLTVQPDQPARIVIDDRAGVIVMGADVRISEVAISQGNLTISVTETPQVSQPNAFSEGGQTKVVPRTSIQVDDGSGKKFAILKPGVSLQQLVDGLNSLGVGPRDMISILQTIKAAGALQADIEVM
ncbi:flagellar basal body P-ring protein FlgI [Govanella unica]|uniref:Flagellar P-ring protein n=1 Tax=Govanella unica TaxID=2975056 RepID=A0A9X3TWY5_9PROT|nr:flagellar basal body P-ring protein FlgI [Govania unica]MDA5193212.1 flagellar basal body P-ring protein FlgI [Govania unica]